MALPPQKFREIVFLILFTSDFSTSETEETALMLMNELKVTKKSVMEAHEVVKQISLKLEEIDAKITCYSTDYSFERISRVEKTILRLGLYEFLFCKDLPPLVAIAEAIRLTRKFGTPESSNFVNAVFDRLYKNSLVESLPDGNLICSGSETL